MYIKNMYDLNTLFYDEHALDFQIQINCIVCLGGRNTIKVGLHKLNYLFISLKSVLLTL